MKIGDWFTYLEDGHYRRMRPWAGVVLAMLFVGTILTAGVLFANERYASAARRDALVAQQGEIFARTVAAYGWTVTGEPSEHNNILYVTVAFGDCINVRVSAPLEHPEDITLLIPDQEVGTLKRKLADTPFKSLYDARGNYQLLWGCFIDPIWPVETLQPSSATR